MLPYLSTDSSFPSTDKALVEPNGLLAAGADLSCKRLIDAYSLGIFPWFSGGEPIMWWSPDPRVVFFVDQFKVHKSVVKTLNKLSLRVTLNNNFEQVIIQCSQPRKEDKGNNSGTWITKEMIQAYLQLHRLGHAHSLEVWQQDELVGGIYGISSGGVFCGESMFSRVSNGSKIALSCLIKYIKQFHYTLVDCQVENPHLMRLGAVSISRKRYIDILQSSQKLDLDQTIWRTQDLQWQNLLRNS